MGDRAVVVFRKEHTLTERETYYKYSPMVYLHWNGSKDNVLYYIDKLAETMEGREGDLDYSIARFIGICHEDIKGNLSLGVSNCPVTDDTDNLFYDELGHITQGDNGVYVVDIDTYQVERNYERYVANGEDDFDREPAEEYIFSDYAKGYIDKAKLRNALLSKDLE